jgi:hypothetical protein
MDFIKAFRLSARLMNQFERANAKAAADNAIYYFSGMTCRNCVRLDNCEGLIVFRH